MYVKLFINVKIFIIIIIIITIIIIILGKSSDTFLQMLIDLNFSQNLTYYIFMKANNIAIRCTNYIYCRCNKQWTSPDLLQS